VVLKQSLTTSLVAINNWRKSKLLSFSIVGLIWGKGGGRIASFWGLGGFMGFGFVR